MAHTEHTSERLVVRSGSTTLVLDKQADKAALLRKFLFWQRSPIERPLSEIKEVKVRTEVDRASGVEVCGPTIVMRDQSVWTIPAEDKVAAAATVTVLRDFLGHH